MKEYIDVNKNAWNIKTNTHLESDFYDNQSFLNGQTSLNNIELELLGNIEGKSILHLQCHFGQDSLSLARLGAKVTAVDFSEKAIEVAKAMNLKLNLDVNFICSNVYDLPQYLDRQFDYVFTSYGVIGWLEDLDSWAAIASRFLKKAGKFIFVEFHPVVWMFDNKAENIIYNYFKEEPIEENLQGTYADRSSNIEYKTITWNHSLGEIIGSLLKHEIQIKYFEEYDYSVYNCFENTIEDRGKYRIKNLGNKIPMMFSLVGEK